MFLDEYLATIGNYQFYVKFELLVFLSSMLRGDHLTQLPLYCLLSFESRPNRQWHQANKRGLQILVVSHSDGIAFLGQRGE